MVGDVALKYPKIKRFPIGKNQKDRLTQEEVTRLLRAKVVVEEKMDGTPVSFIANRFIIFAEDLRRQHSIFYMLPGRYAVFDIFDTQRGVFLFRDEKVDLSNDLRNGRLRVDGVDPILFFAIPQISIGKFNIENLIELIRLSAYAKVRKTREPDFMEGIVVKPYRDLFPEEFIAGKIVRAEFVEGIKQNYLRLSLRLNAIGPSTPVVLFLQS